MLNPKVREHLKSLKVSLKVFLYDDDDVDLRKLQIKEIARILKTEQNADITYRCAVCENIYKEHSSQIPHNTGMCLRCEFQSLEYKEIF